jgi:hypothetical protein
MASLRAAVAVMVLLWLAGVMTTVAATRALSMVQPGVELAFPWRLAMASSNWFVRLQPWLAIFGVGAAALGGAAVSRGTTISQERNLLLGWLAVVGACLVVETVGLAMPGSRISALILVAGFGMVSLVASMVVASHLLWRLRRLGSPFHTWQVIVAAVVLTVLGPLGLLGAAAVWVYSGRLLERAHDGPS